MGDALTLQQSLVANLPPSTYIIGQKTALETARKFESVFLSLALKSMFQGVAADPFSANAASENWRELLTDEYANAVVERGGIGLAAPIARELLKMQEVSQP